MLFQTKHFMSLPWIVPPLNRLNILISSLQTLHCITEVVMRASYYSVVECKCLLFVVILYCGDTFARFICFFYPKWDIIEITKYRTWRENILQGHLFSSRGELRSQILSWPDTVTRQMPVLIWELMRLIMIPHKVYILFCPGLTLSHNQVLIE